MRRVRGVRRVTLAAKQQAQRERQQKALGSATGGLRRLLPAEASQDRSVPDEVLVDQYLEDSGVHSGVGGSSSGCGAAREGGMAQAAYNMQVAQAQATLDTHRGSQIYQEQVRTAQRSAVRKARSSMRGGSSGDTTGDTTEDTTPFSGSCGSGDSVGSMGAVDEDGERDDLAGVGQSMLQAACEVVKSAAQRPATRPRGASAVVKAGSHRTPANPPPVAGANAVTKAEAEAQVV